VNFKEYQRAACETAVYPEIGTLGEIYPVMGLASEAGELSGAIKKIYRDEAGAFYPNTLKELSLELGDVLWYVAQVAEKLGLELDDIATANLAKLESRKQRGVLQGSGSDR
jgi:NTP pyrophosphatase (non-canonical NTP hydrolase)